MGFNDGWGLVDEGEITREGEIVMLLGILMIGAKDHC